MTAPSSSKIPKGLNLHVEGHTVFIYKDDDNTLRVTDNLGLFRDYPGVLVGLDELHNINERQILISKIDNSLFDIESTDYRPIVDEAIKKYPQSSAAKIEANKHLQNFLRNYKVFSAAERLFLEHFPHNIILSTQNESPLFMFDGKNRKYRGYHLNDLVVLGPNYSHAVLAEEFRHFIEANLQLFDPKKEGRFTSSLPWKKAWDFDNKNESPLLFPMNRALSREKGNRGRNPTLSSREKYLEGFQDIGQHENILIEAVRRDGNASSIGFNTNLTIDAIMREAHPACWLLYRGCEPDECLYQKKDGAMIVASKDAKPPRGTERIRSYPETLFDVLIAMRLINPAAPSAWPTTRRPLPELRNSRDFRSGVRNTDALFGHLSEKEIVGFFNSNEKRARILAAAENPERPSTRSPPRGQKKTPE